MARPRQQEAVTIRLNDDEVMVCYVRANEDGFDAEAVSMSHDGARLSLSLCAYGRAAGHGSTRAV